jgi:hypothetical protein
MSLHGVESFMYRLKNDARTQAEFKERAALAFEGFELSDAEIRALTDGDVTYLFGIGVHPLLLVPYSRYAGIPRPEYLARLQPLRNTRVTKS